jgi:hypothetical protein
MKTKTKFQCLKKKGLRDRLKDLEVVAPYRNKAHASSWFMYSCFG